MAFDRYSSQGRLIEWVGRSKRVLDIGCGQGAVAGELVKNGCRVVGIECDRKAAAKARLVCDYVHVCDVERFCSLPYPHRSFDIILFGDVLEHMYAPGRALIKLLPYLKDHGQVIASTPNIANWGIRFQLLLGRFDYQECDAIVIWDHLRFFTFSAFRRLFGASGLQVTHVDVTPGLHLCKTYKRLIAWWLCRLPGYGRASYLLCYCFKGFLGHQMVFVAPKKGL